jgi:hypothetical protein
MRASRHDRTIREGSDIIDHQARIKAEYTALLAALRKAGWKDCGPECTCRGKLA